MKYSLALFDYDGTLADAFPWLMGVIQQVADQYHLPEVELDDSETFRRLDAHQMVMRMGFSFWKIPLIARDMRRLATRDAHKIPLFPGVDQLLHGLSRQGIRLGVVSSNSSENVQRAIGPALAALIQYYECNVSIFGKAARIRKVLQQSGASPQDTIFIGDELRDLEAAQKVGVAFGAVAWGYTDVSAFLERSTQEIFMSMEALLARFDLS